MCPGLMLGLLVKTLVDRRLLPPVGFVPPGQTALDLLQVGVDTVDHYLADRSAVAILFIPLNCDCLVEYHLG